KPASADSTSRLRMSILAKTYRYNDKGVKVDAPKKTGAKK
ncbi:pilus assembly protein PilP, partial [Pseudomonas sp. ATCC 13867]